MAKQKLTKEQSKKVEKEYIRIFGKDISCWPFPLCKDAKTIYEHIKTRVLKDEKEGGENMNNTKLYIGNLSYESTSDQLKELFTGAGSVVSAEVISDRDSGRSKGFGFVEMKSEEEAKKAIEMFNGKDFQGRNLVVNEARPKQPREFQPRRE